MSTRVFEPYLQRWNLPPAGEALHTHSSDLLPVLFRGKPAMLKVARSTEETVGNRLMVWLTGQGVARVYAHDAAAIVLERLKAAPSLTDLVSTGQDDEATRILCRAASRVHTFAAAQSAPPPLPDLRRWFRSLERAAAQGGLLETTWNLALSLLVSPQDVTILHGDIHHGNVLHSLERGWLLIDPKGIVGERGFDFANIFYNPTTSHALTPGRLARQVQVVCQETGLPRQRLLAWIAAYGGLSAAWFLEDGEHDEARKVLKVVEIALAELSVSG